MDVIHARVIFYEINLFTVYLSTIPNVHYGCGYSTVESMNVRIKPDRVNP